MKTSFESLDEIIKGFHNSILTVIVGRPSMGKSTLAFNIAVKIAQKERMPVENKNYQT